MLQCVAVCCSVLQCVAGYCSVLQCVRLRLTMTQTSGVLDPFSFDYCNSVLQCVAVSCSVF